VYVYNSMLLLTQVWEESGSSSSEDEEEEGEDGAVGGDSGTCSYLLNINITKQKHYLNGFRLVLDKKILCTINNLETSEIRDAFKSSTLLHAFDHQPLLYCTSYGFVLCMA